ncbi:MAG TPA: chloride channel protein [Candidatus Eisenbacteria bacterium]
MTPLRRIAAELDKLELYATGRVLLLSSVVGIIAGCGAILFQLICQVASHFLLADLAGYRPTGPAGEPALFHGSPVPLRLWLIPVVPAIGGLLVGRLVQRFAPEAAGHGTDEAVDAFHRRRGLVRGRVPIVKFLASALTVGSGGSGGREGPIAQAGAGFGSFLAQRLALPERERRILLAAGVGAGVGSIFRAPLAGALFAAEVLYSDPEFESEVIIPAAIATIVAYCVFSLEFGFGTLFLTPRFEFHSAWELIPYTALALVVALVAGIFVKLFYGIHSAFKRWSVPAAVKPMVGGLATGTVAVILFLAGGGERALDVLSIGYGTVQDALLGQIPLAVLLLVAGGKLLTTSFSIGSGGSAGVFGPSMVIGGAVGGSVGILAHKVMPGVVTQPAAFVPVGMAGFFAAAANTPISTLIMVSEMIGNYQLLLPALWVCAISYLLGRRWTLYRSQVPGRADSPAHRGAILAGVLRGLSVRDVARERPVHVLQQSATLDEIIRAFTRSSQHCFPVVDPRGTMIGSITLDQLREHFDELGERVPLIAHDLVTQPSPSLSLDDDLDTALQRMVSLDAAELPIVDAGERRRVVGLLSRRDILAVYNRRRMEGALRAE